MSIISFSFLIFLLIFGLFYFLLPKKWQWKMLLAGNIVFYAFSGAEYLLWLLSCSFFTWYAALRIENDSRKLKEKLTEVSDKEQKAGLRRAFDRRKKARISITLVLTLGVWILLKYVPFLLDSAFSLFHREDLQGSLKFIVPLGMSFYTFDAIGYLIDVSKGKYAADRNYFHFLTFVSCFLHIIQGPFSRYDALGKTLFAEKHFSYDRLCQGLSRILWGYFKKLLVADKLAIAVGAVFSAFENHWGVNILTVMFLYGIQLYADFSGYMDIVCGVSKVLGIGLAENFSQPYFSRSVEEFWRRWHMSLGHWFRDYVFYPVSRSETARKIRNRFPAEAARHLVSFLAMFCVWTGSGWWHGANWTFLIWGWLNMAVMFFSQIAEPLYRKLREGLHISAENRVWNLFRVIRTFCITCALFFIIRADSLHTAGQMLTRMVSAFNRKLITQPLLLFPGMSTGDVGIALTGIALIFIVDLLCENGKWETLKQRTPIPVRSLAYAFLIFALILFAGTAGDITANFIYTNF